MTATHNIEAVKFENNYLFLLIDGKKIKLSLDDISKKLKSACDVERNMFKISPSGYGIHWPLIDEDLSVNSLLKAAQN